MGKGDIKSKRGKISNGSSGVSRQKKEKSKLVAPVKAKKAPEKTETAKPAAKKTATAKKPAAEKPAAEKKTTAKKTTTKKKED